MRCSMSIVLVLACSLACRARADDNVKSVIEKAVKAHGGEANLSKVKVIDQTGKGVVSFQGMDVEFSARIVTQLPDKSREEVTFEGNGQKIPTVRVFNGKEGWESGMGETRELDDVELAEMKSNMFENYVETILPLLNDKNLTLTLIGDQKVEDKPVIGVKVSAKDQKEIKLFFDKDSGLLVKSERQSLNPDKMETTSESFFSEFKEINGVRQPMKQVTKHDGVKFLEFQTSECKLADKTDDSSFAKPKSP